MQQVEQMSVVFLWYWLKTFLIGQELAGLVALVVHGFELDDFEKAGVFPGRGLGEEGMTEGGYGE